MERIHAGYRAFTGHVFTQTQADAYNAAVERAERSPSEENRNGAHNLFNSIAMTPATVGEIYHDNGRAFGRQTRFFRETSGGIEWMYGVDYANGSTRWYAFHPGVGQSIAGLKAGGMFLSRLCSGNVPAA